ncbi:MAG: ABC transporter ATP-binding protein, partial [Oscillospiraceae bacterium]|nr:ABC transporter ATP-binding protein [Oscillospiraceae bacterium]
MATVTLKNVMKIYPYSGDDEKAAKRRARKNEGVEKKTNLQITDKGVVAVQQFNLEIADKEFIVLVGP